jgi:hypothetical protein
MMALRTHRSIKGRLIRISGYPAGGWKVADPPDGRELAFDFAITDDGSGGFLLDFRSVDGAYVNDYSYATLEEAILSAQSCFGIAPGEWTADHLTSRFS